MPSRVAVTQFECVAGVKAQRGIRPLALGLFKLLPSLGDPAGTCQDWNHARLGTGRERIEFGGAQRAFDGFVQATDLAQIDRQFRMQGRTVRVFCKAAFEYRYPLLPLMIA